MRQQKVARQIQKDLGEIFQTEGLVPLHGTMVTVTVVRIVPDLSYAKVYLSIFPFAKAQEVLKEIARNAWQIRMSLGKRVRNQLRIVPELAFFLDDSMEYSENIETLLAK